MLRHQIMHDCCPEIQTCFLTSLHHDYQHWDAMPLVSGESIRDGLAFASFLLEEVPLSQRLSIFPYSYVRQTNFMLLEAQLYPS